MESTDAAAAEPLDQKHVLERFVFSLQHQDIVFYDDLIVSFPIPSIS